MDGWISPPFMYFYFLTNQCTSNKMSNHLREEKTILLHLLL